MGHLWKRTDPERGGGSGQRLVVVAVAVVFGAVVATGVSWASIPDSGGTIHGCYKTAGTAHPLKIVDSAKSASCPKGYTSLNWDQAPPGVGVGTEGAAAASSGSSTCVDGQISLYAGNQFPPNEKAANGQLVLIASDSTLYALIGTTYGGDGTTTFAMPNLQSLAPNGMTYTICAFGTFP